MATRTELFVPRMLVSYTETHVDRVDVRDEA